MFDHIHEHRMGAFFCHLLLFKKPIYTSRAPTTHYRLQRP